jgi:hypothetical protein
MATSPLRLQQGYGIGNALQPLPPFSIIANRAPTQQDKARIGTFWVYTAANNVYVLTSVTGGNSNWLTLSNGGAGIFTSLIVNGPSTFNGNITQTVGVTSLLATTTTGLTNNGVFTQNGNTVINACPVFGALNVLEDVADTVIYTQSARLGGSRHLLCRQTSADTQSVNWTTVKSRAGAVVQVGDELFEQNFVARGNTGESNSARIIVTAGNPVPASAAVPSSLAISTTDTAGTLADRLTISTSGAVNLPSQPAFRAVRTADTGAVTGNNTPYDVIFQATQYNIGPCYTAGTGVFQAPIAGRYLLSANIIVDNIAAGMTSASVGFWDGAQFVGTLTYMNPVPVLIGGGTFFSFPINTIISLAALANINVRVNLAGGALAATIPANITCFFAAELLG